MYHIAVLGCAVSFLLLDLSGAATASKPIFPAIRRRQEEAAKEAAQAKNTSAKQPAEPAAPLVVPAPVDVGDDGFPELPAVSQMLGEASSTLNSVNSEATFLKKRLVQAEGESESKMAKQKAAFEAKLKAQERSNRAVIEQSAHISSAISALKKGNTALRTHAKQLQETNRVMRSELQILESRLGAARDFVATSLLRTDDSKAADLAVLQIKVQENHHDRDSKEEESEDDADDSDDADDQESDSADDNKGGESFMALSSTVQRVRDNTFEADLAEMEELNPQALSQQQRAGSDSSPDNLLESLSKEVADLAKQERTSEKKLKDFFIRDFRAGARRHQALLSQQRGLNATRTSLVEMQSHLRAADTHLETTRTHLEQRLHGMGLFMQHLAHLALAPEREVKHLLQTLPKAPTLPHSKKNVAQGP